MPICAGPCCEPSTGSRRHAQHRLSAPAEVGPGEICPREVGLLSPLCCPLIGCWTSTGHPRGAMSPPRASGLCCGRAEGQSPLTGSRTCHGSLPQSPSSPSRGYQLRSAPFPARRAPHAPGMVLLPHRHRGSHCRHPQQRMGPDPTRRCRGRSRCLGAPPRSQEREPYNDGSSSRPLMPSTTVPGCGADDMQFRDTLH